MHMCWPKNEQLQVLEEQQAQSEPTHLFKKNYKTMLKHPTSARKITKTTEHIYY